MSLINPIQYTIYDQVVPRDKLPIIEQPVDSASYGTVTLQIPPLTTLLGTTCSVYRYAPPTSTDHRWSRVQPDIWTDDICHFHVTPLSTGMYKITWQFLPASIVGIGDGQYFGIEFFVNQSNSATVAQIAPKLIIKTVNTVDFTGVTGFIGGSFVGITGPRGYTGIQGGAGVQGPPGSATGYQGITGKDGVTGFDGITGSGGITGSTFGATGLAGSVGSTGPQGVTGLAGSAGGGGSLYYTLPGNVTLTNVTSASDVTGFAITLAANTIYAITCTIKIDTNNVSVWHYLDFSGPASPNSVSLGLVSIDQDHTAASVYYGTSSFCTAFASGMGWAYSNRIYTVQITGIINNGANAGAIQLREWRATGNSVVVVYAGSCITATKIG